MQPRPRLSVAIATRDDPADLAPRLDALLRQVATCDGELIVVTCAQRVSAGVPPCIRVHHLPGTNVFECRAAAFAIARGDIVALTEDHCVHAPDWCTRILRDFTMRPGLVLLGGAVANGSPHRFADRMNYWMTFATFAPGQVTARQPCIAQYAVRVSALEEPPIVGELERSLIAELLDVPGAVHVDPRLVVRHEQSHGFWKTFAVHFHNGRSTAGLTRGRNGRIGWREAVARSSTNALAHLRRTHTAFAAGKRSRLSRGAHVALVMPLLVCHAFGEVVGFRRGPGTSAQRLV
jgi:hypothetical protein